MRKLFTLVTMVLFALFSCEQDSEDLNKELEPGVLYMQMELQYIPAEVSSMTGYLSREGFETIEFELEINNTSAYAVIHGIEGGSWLLTVHAYNHSGDIIFSGSSEVKVIPNEITPVHLDLTTTGSLDITVRWGDDSTTGNDEFEDNDVMEEASRIFEGVYYHNLSIEAGDDDWFKISHSAPHIGVVINYRSHHGDIRLELYSPEGNLISSSKHLHDYSIIDCYADGFDHLYVRVFSASGESRKYMIWWQDWYDF